MLVTLAALFCLGAVFGWTRQDFGWFLIGLVAIPFLALVSIIATIQALRSRLYVTAIALLVALPAGWEGGFVGRDPISFFLWAPFHYSELREAARRPQIATWWWSGGMAGMEFDDYLVTDPSDRLATRSTHREWLRKVGQSCEITDVKRMWPSIYIISTADCPFDGLVEP